MLQPVQRAALGGAGVVLLAAHPAWHTYINVPPSEVMLACPRKPEFMTVRAGSGHHPVDAGVRTCPYTPMCIHVCAQIPYVNGWGPEMVLLLWC